MVRKYYVGHVEAERKLMVPQEIATLSQSGSCSVQLEYFGEVTVSREDGEEEEASKRKKIRYTELAAKVLKGFVGK